MNTGKNTKIINKWDQLRQKYFPKRCISTDKLSRFLEVDLVGNNEFNSLYGCKGDKSINPCVLMDARHKAVERSRKNLDNGVCPQIDSKISMAYIRDESQYIKRELLKFKKGVHKPPAGVKGKMKNKANSKTEKCSLNDLACSLHEMVLNSELALKGNKWVNRHGDLKTIGVKPQQALQVGQFIELYDYKTSKKYDSTSSRCLTFVRVQKETTVFPTERKPNQQSKDHDDVKNCAFHKSNKTEFRIMESGATVNVLRVRPLQVNIPPIGYNLSTDEISSSACSTASNHNERDDIISRLFAQHFHRDNFLKRTYFLKWLHFMTVQRINSPTMCKKNGRIHKIHVFLDRIKDTKRNLRLKPPLVSDCRKEHLSTIAKQYQNKIKMQQDIINLQKLKLDRQERTIMELRLCRFAKDTTESKYNIKKGLEAVLKNGSFKHQTKAKCLQLTARLQRDDNNFTKLQGKKLPIPRFLVNMQARAWERSVRHEKAKQRRIILEAEKEAAKHAAEEAKRMEDEEAKKVRIELLKERRRQEKLEKYNKEKQRQKHVENSRKAQEFYRKVLMRRIGLEVFQRLLKRKRINKKKSDQFRRIILYKQFMNSWKNYTKTEWNSKFLLAEKHYETTRKTCFFKAWFHLLNDSKSKFLVAADWYEYKITERYLIYWVKIHKTNGLIEETKIKQAESHYDWHMKWKLLDHWRRLPHILKLQKITEERRLRWRMKIWELLPDYRPILHDAD